MILRAALFCLLIWSAFTIAAKCPFQLLALEKITLESPTDPLNSGWKASDLVRHAISVYSPNTFTDNVVDVPGNLQSKSRQHQLQRDLKKKAAAADRHQEPGYEARRPFLLDAENRSCKKFRVRVDLVHQILHCGVDLV